MWVMQGVCSQRCGQALREHEHAVTLTVHGSCSGQDLHRLMGSTRKPIPPTRWVRSCREWLLKVGTSLSPSRSLQDERRVVEQKE